jgi:glycosyltransferase involved in cell wall biosynthesis
MIAVSHPTGNQFVRALLSGLEKKGMLARFFTTLNAPGENFLRWLPVSLREQIGRRAFDLPGSKITSYPLREITRLLVKSPGQASVDAVYTGLDSAVAAWVRGNYAEIDAVHCYEDGALETFRAAGEAGVRRVYELPIAYWETVHKILNDEAARLPAWEPTLYATRDSREKLERKTREIELADIVICPSQFVHDSMPEVIRRDKKCVIAKFGSPQLPTPVQHKSAGGKLRVLFAGAMSQRKGLADLFAAMKLLDRADVELVVMGSAILPMNFYREQYPGFIHEAPRPHAAVMELMQTCDVLALPSLVEGRALVQQEALACGLPLIVTANAGGEDLVEEGAAGFLVPVRAPEKIADKIAWFAEHRDALPAMRDAARRKAAACTWEDYSNAVINAGGGVA